MPLSVENIRVGKIYRLENHGEIYDFEVIERIGSANYKCKDIHTLEYFELSDLLKYGRGKDYDLDERRA